MRIHLEALHWHDGIGVVKVVRHLTDGWISVIPIERDLVQKLRPGIRLPKLPHSIDLTDEELVEIPVGHITTDQAVYAPLAKALVQQALEAIVSPTLEVRVHLSELISLEQAERLADLRRSDAGRHIEATSMQHIREARAAIWSIHPGISPRHRNQAAPPKPVDMVDVFARISATTFEKAMRFARTQLQLHAVPVAWHEAWGVVGSLDGAAPLPSPQHIGPGRWVVMAGRIPDRPLPDAWTLEDAVITPLQAEIWYRSRSQVLRRYRVDLKLWRTHRPPGPGAFRVEIVQPEAPEHFRAPSVTRRPPARRPRYGGWGGQVIDPDISPPSMPSMPKQARPYEDAVEVHPAPRWLQRMLARDERLLSWAIVAYLCRFLVQLES